MVNARLQSLSQIAQRMVRTAAWTKAIAELMEVLLINAFQQVGSGTLNDLVFQGGKS
jgi:hypothetical protein